MFNIISNQVFYTLGLYDIWNMLDNQQKETLTEAINIGIDEGIKQVKVEPEVRDAEPNPSFGQWIKTTDKFPKPEMMGEKILIIYKNEIHIGKIAPNGWNLFCSDGNCWFNILLMDEVTHWMPLPKL